jgi:alkylation response protein AidB-like acyl-CoA dehydrogenase
VRASAINVGIAQRALEESARYAVQRTHRGVSIGHKFATIRSALGAMRAQVDSARAYVRDVAQLVDDGQTDLARPPRPLGS